MSDPRYEFLRFRDLLAANIVTSRPDLSAKIREHDFPRPMKTSKAPQATAYWRKQDVYDWLDAHFPQQPAGTGNDAPEQRGRPT